MTTEIEIPLTEFYVRSTDGGKKLSGQLFPNLGDATLVWWRYCNCSAEQCAAVQRLKASKAKIERTPNRENCRRQSNQYLFNFPENVDIKKVYDAVQAAQTACTMCTRGNKK